MLKKCLQCGKEFVPSRVTHVFCSDKCRSNRAYHNVENALRKEALKRDGNKCVSCGATKDLGIHHIDFSGMTETPNNSLDNLITLCHHCHSNLHGEKRTVDSTVFKFCLFCGKGFETKLGKIADGRGKYCSRECLYASQKGSTSVNKGKYTTRVFKSCPICGKEFWTTQGRIDVGKDKYCSKECGYEARKRQPRNMTCKVCGKSYLFHGSKDDHRARFCSNECRKIEHPNARDKRNKIY